MKTIEMALINTFVVKIILCLTLVNAELVAVNNKISQADLPKSSDDPRLVKLQKEIAWQNKFSRETANELKTFTNLMHRDVLSDIESEKNYISQDLKDKLKNYGKELANILKDKSSSSGTSISIVEKHMPAINNYFDVRIRSKAYFNLKKPEDLENKIQGTVNVQHSHRQDETPEINKSELLQVTDPNLVNPLDKKIKDALGSTMEQLKELNEKILQAEPSITKTADEQNKAEQLSLSLTDVLNKFENECQDYLTNEFRYLKSNLVARHETLNAQIDHVVRNIISKLELVGAKFSSEFTSKGQIRFFLYNTDANSKPVTFEEKKYTPWFNFDSNGNINVYAKKRPFTNLWKGFIRQKKYH
ncbi:hypothetical protein THOM_1925 [Trachipleistophora hominis]|uniref:Uncharacterized protein n=1 Tax=Trachipleistophora hominis TaxID=72359 RepID=L7JV05_TRAHO|nr:hypothetical protein THOM_1925 [Trachipleistophora hominis]